MKQVVIYPTGFIGYDAGWPIVRNEQPTDTSNILARFATSTKDKISISNRNVEQIFKLYITRSASTTDVEFITNVIATATNAFGCYSLYEWVQMQLQSPYLSAYHRRFLNETLGYIFLDEKRSTMLTSWRGLLHPTEADATDKSVLLRHQDILAKRNPESFMIQNVVQEWISKDGGLQDMIYTLHLIFGDGK